MQKVDEVVSKILSENGYSGLRKKPAGETKWITHADTSWRIGSADKDRFTRIADYHYDGVADTDNEGYED